jgi:hypothetical protein
MNARKTIAVVISMVAMMAITVKVAAQTDLSSIPLDPAARILQQGTVVVPANAGSSAVVSVPGRGIFSIDFAVQPGQQLLLMLLTDAQYKAVLAGQTPQGDPLIKQYVSGVASVNYTLDPGVYDIFFISSAPTGIQVTYRGTWRPL